jgi:hypothetical protein
MNAQSPNLVADFPLRSNDFFRCSSRGDELFTVRDGMSAVVALEQASCFLAAALKGAYALAEMSEDDSAHAPAYLIEMAKGVMDAAIGTISMNRDRQAGQDAGALLACLEELVSLATTRRGVDDLAMNPAWDRARRVIAEAKGVDHD